MSTQWFYMRGDERVGPFTQEELIQVLQATPEPHGVLVWDPRRADWQPAGSVIEIAGQLPPPLPALPPRNPAVVPVPFETAEKIAQLYRRLVLLVGAQIVLSFVFLGISEVRSDSAVVTLLAIVAPLLVLGFSIALVVTAYRLAAALGSGTPALWAVGMFLSCISIFVLLALSHKAQVWCRQYGIKVGFFGPTKESIEELKRKGMTSAFD
ncbi:MAG TPA: DUF4339 domain-containing protein [Thermoanaerobaculia bacterium]|nr:DUF4339 domain-containing protein [Thermoanaerobaculia bacterium]